MSKFFSFKIQFEKDFVVFLKNQNILNELEVAVSEYENDVGGTIREGKGYPPFRFQFTLDLHELKLMSGGFSFFPFKIIQILHR